MSATAVPLRPIKKGSVLKLWIGLAFLALIAAAVAWAGTGRFAVTTTDSGLKVQTLHEGKGEKIGPYDGVLIEYVGRLPDGTVFDSTQGKGPAPMLVSQVIPGFSEALQMMKEGGSCHITIPPELAYGEHSPPGSGIPANSTLEFDVQVVRVVPNAMLQMGAAPPPHGGM